MATRIPLPEEEIVTLYRVGGLTEREIGGRYGVTRMPIKRVLRTHGVGMRPSHRRPIYQWDKTFFDAIDTEAKAYWLGFLAADGSVADRGVKGMVVTLSLHDRDRTHIERFCADIGCTAPIRDAGQNCSRVALSGPDLAKALIRQGVTPRKTFTHHWPNLAGDSLRHYLRGYFDGDGTVGLSSRNAHMSVIGTPEFIGEWQAHIAGTVGRKGCVMRPKNSPNMAIATYSGIPQCRAIHTYLYGGATVYLSRKGDFRFPTHTKQWSDYHLCCIQCGTTETPHNARGYCKVCYRQWRPEVRTG